MTGLLALVCFVLAAVVFGINALDVGTVGNVWGLFFLALGFVFGALGGGIAYVQAQRSA